MRIFKPRCLALPIDGISMLWYKLFQLNSPESEDYVDLRTIKGFRDILPPWIDNWQRLESEARTLFESFGFEEIRPPMLEWTELFRRGLGRDSDVVSKEMYTFQDSKGRAMTLRPEATASVVRAYIQNKLYQDAPIRKLYTMGPMFRHEKPQKERYRQFYQINAELFGDPGPKSDAEVITMAMTYFEKIGIGEDLTLHLNSLGCPQCRPAFKERLNKYLESRNDDLCVDCRRRLQVNPLRVFDCKVEGCNQAVWNAPSVLDFICIDCRKHIEAVKAYLAGVGVSFVMNHKLVRGLDYYNRTTFEIQTERLGAQNAVAGGGRYDGLVKLLGGPDSPAMGFAVGVDRVVALLEKEREVEQRIPDLFIAALGEEAEKTSFNWALELRKSGLFVEIDYVKKGLKALMKKADRLGARKVLIVGEDELSRGEALLRDMDTKEQENVALGNIVDNLTRALSQK